MKLFNNIAIVGTGLIGGSIGLEIKKRGLATKVIGISRHKKTLAIAKERRAIDRGALGLEILREADFVILAAPVGAIIKLAPEISKNLKPGCVVSDVGSTKSVVVKKLEGILPKGIHFVGGHPLAGGERRGILNAKSGLFKGAVCILTKTAKTDLSSLRKVSKFWRLLGCKIRVTSPKNHDRALSFVSHLPHIIAFGLINAVPANYLEFASGGFKDTTRIALSDSEVWKDIFITNKKQIIEAIGDFQARIKNLKTDLKSGDEPALADFIRQARAKRKLI